MPSRQKAPHLLILRLSAMGDVAMTIPVIYSLARQYPHVGITVVTSAFFRRLFINHPDNIDFFIANTRSEHHGIMGLYRMIRQLKKLEFTAVADLHDVLRSRIIRSALGSVTVPVAVVDKNRSGRQMLTKEKSRVFQPNYVDRYADVFRQLGYTVVPDFHSVIEETAPRAGVGIAPFARYATKTYPAELMEQTARIISDAGHRVYLFGAKGREADELRKWAERNPSLTVVAGTMSLKEVIEAMARLKFIISMDSANMHLALLAGTPVVSVWGSTIPQCGFLGYNQSTDNAVWLDLPCQPCSIAGTEKCPKGHFSCMMRLKPELIANTTMKLL